MNRQDKSSVPAWLLAGITACCLAGCGGGAGQPAADAAERIQTAGDEAQQPQQTDAAAKALALTPAPVELVRNGLFDDGLVAWTVGDAVLAASELRPGGKALNVGWQAVQTFGSLALLPGQAYTLLVTARNETASGKATLALRFHRPAGYEIFRTYKTTVVSSSYQTYRIDFTAPEYVAMADVAITAAGSRARIDTVSLSTRPAIVQTEPIASAAGSHVPAGYELVFNDEFNGSTLNRAKWATRYIYGAETTDRLNDEKQRFRDNDNHRVAGGVLSLVARKVSGNDPQGVNYESGMIRSLWTSRYGYYEARVKMPGGLGVWPAFWLNSDVSAQGRLEWPPEIDIFEFVNNGVEDKVHMLNSGVRTNKGVASPIAYADPAFNRQWSSYHAPFNFNEGWHTIGALWDETTVTLFVDGKKIYTRGYSWTYADTTLAGPAHILLNLAIGGAWAGRHGIDDSAFPQSLQIDWVRAYARKTVN